MISSRRLSLVISVAIATVLATLLAACGDDSSATPTATSSPTAQATASTATAQPSQSGGSASATATRTNAPPPTATATATPVGPARCASNNLALATASAGAAAGTHYVSLAFTNKGTSACVISGYPGVSLQDANGQQLGQPAERDAGGSSGSAPVTLAPGDSAHALIALAAHENFDAGVCSGPSTTVVVYPPDETQALTVPFVDYVCPGFSVRAVAPGKNEPGR